MFECRTRRAVDFAPAPKKATEIFSVCMLVAFIHVSHFLPWEDQIHCC